jgi:hypothetical protein
MFERGPEPSGRRFFEVSQHAINTADIRSRMQRGQLVCSSPTAFILDEPRALLVVKLIDVVHGVSVPRA